MSGDVPVRCDPEHARRDDPELRTSILRAAAAEAAKHEAVRFAAFRDLTAERILRVLAGRVVRARRWVWDHRECRIYRMAAGDASRAVAADEFAVDRFEDLLRFVPVERWQRRSTFLADAAQRLSEGHRVVTRIEDDRLAAYGWLAPRQSRSIVSEVRQEASFPPNSAVAYDFFTHPSFRRRGLQRSALATALRLAASVPGTEHVWIGVLADNGPSRRNIERLGWVHDRSLVLRTRLGRHFTGAGDAIPAAAAEQPAPDGSGARRCGKSHTGV